MFWMSQEDEVPKLAWSPFIVGAAVFTLIAKVGSAVTDASNLMLVACVAAANNDIRKDEADALNALVFGCDGDTEGAE